MLKLLKWKSSQFFITSKLNLKGKRNLILRIEISLQYYKPNTYCFCGAYFIRTNINFIEETRVIWNSHISNTWFLKMTQQTSSVLLLKNMFVSIEWPFQSWAQHCTCRDNEVFHISRLFHITRISFNKWYALVMYWTIKNRKLRTNNCPNIYQSILRIVNWLVLGISDLWH